MVVSELKCRPASAVKTRPVKKKYIVRKEAKNNPFSL